MVIFAQSLKQSKTEEHEQLDVCENMISEKVNLCKETVEMPVLQENTLQHLLQDMPKLQKLMKPVINPFAAGPIQGV